MSDQQKGSFCGEKTYVYDFDSILDWGTDFDFYCNKTFVFDKQFQNKYRLVTAEQMIKNFASDRSHMLIKNNKGSQQVKKY